MTPMALRSGGLPVSLLPPLTAKGSRQELATLETAQATIRDCSETLKDAVGKDRFLEALAWQNPGAAAVARSFARSSGTVSRNAKHRDREHRLIRYLTRYTAKTETIGFFGPVGYLRAVRGRFHIQQLPVEPLIRRSITVTEPWAVQELADRLAKQPDAAPWLLLRRRATFSLQRATGAFTDLEWDLLLASDGTRTQAEVLTKVAGQSAIAWTRTEALAALGSLRRRGLLTASWNIALDVTAAADLTAAVHAIPDLQTRHTLSSPLDAVAAGVDRLHNASGDPDRVLAAQAALSNTFEQITGQSGSRRPGQSYAGRLVAYQDSLRQGEVTMGDGCWESLTPPLEGMLTIARWLTWSTAHAYNTHFLPQWRQLAGRRLAEAWPELIRAFFGATARPIAAVLKELQHRWQAVWSSCDSQDQKFLPAPVFANRVRGLFTAPAPGWSAAAIHSPDIQLYPRPGSDPGSGPDQYVLSELHISMATMEGPIFEWPYPDRELSRLVNRIIGPQVVPAFPRSWPRNTGRVRPATAYPADTVFAFADAEGLPARTISYTDILIDLDAGGQQLGLKLPDGTVVSFSEFFASFLSAVVADALRSLQAGPHTPRTTAGDLVLIRETWTVGIEDEAFTADMNEGEALLAVRDWGRRHQLPPTVYASLAGETKPFLVDFDSPLMVLAFRNAARAALRSRLATSTVRISEALPHPEQAWLRDTRGERYAAEVRIMLVDPLAPDRITGSGARIRSLTDQGSD